MIVRRADTEIRPCQEAASGLAFLFVMLMDDIRMTKFIRGIDSHVFRCYCDEVDSVIPNDEAKVTTSSTFEPSRLARWILPTLGVVQYIF